MNKFLAISIAITIIILLSLTATNASCIITLEQVQEAVSNTVWWVRETTITEPENLENPWPITNKENTPENLESLSLSGFQEAFIQPSTSSQIVSENYLSEGTSTLSNIATSNVSNTISAVIINLNPLVDRINPEIPHSMFIIVIETFQNLDNGEVTDYCYISAVKLFTSYIESLSAAHQQLINMGETTPEMWGLVSESALNVNEFNESYQLAQTWQELNSISSTVYENNVIIREVLSCLEEWEGQDIEFTENLEDPLSQEDEEAVQNYDIVATVGIWYPEAPEQNELIHIYCSNKTNPEILESSEQLNDTLREYGLDEVEDHPIIEIEVSQSENGNSNIFDLVVRSNQNKNWILLEENQLTFDPIAGVYNNLN